MPLSTKAVPIDKSIPSKTVSGLKKNAPINKEHREASIKTIDIEFERNVKKREKSEDCKESKKNISQEAGITKNINQETGITKNIIQKTGITTNISEEAVITKNVSEEVGITKNVSEETDITKNVSEKAGITKNVSQEAGITKNVNQEAGITKNVSEEAGITKNVSQATGITKNVSEEADIAKNVSQEVGITKNVSQEDDITKNVTEEAGITRNVSEEAGITKNVEGSQSVPLEENDVKKTDDAESTVSVKNATAQTDAAVKYKITPIITKSNTHWHSNVAVPRHHPPISMPFLGERPLVLATHLVPSLPISLFEVLVEAIELATEKPVVLLHEPRTDRTVAKGITDIAILPASETWEEGELLPVSFCFEHHLNKSKSPGVYVDVVVASDCTSYIEDITDLRGHRCSLADRGKQVGAAALLFNHLYGRGESPSFFGNILDANTQIATLQMVAGKQAEVGAVESPVIKCHKTTLPGMESLHILTSLGPLPPYRIMVNKSLSDAVVKKITAYLLNVDEDMEWVERFAPFGVSFVKNSTEFYDISDIKSVVTSVPYY